jgi:hypothetical protein
MTLVMNTLKQIREARRILQERQNSGDLARKEKNLVEQGISILSDQEDILINNCLQDMVGMLNEKNDDLKALLITMEKASKKIEGISNIIRKIAEVVSVLTEITTKAISVGIL